jgi:hypothetical protein
MVIKSLKPFAANLPVIYGDVSISHKGNSARSYHSYFQNPLAQPLLAFSTSLTEIITKMSVDMKRRFNVTVPHYDNLILKFRVDFVGKVW